MSPISKRKAKLKIIASSSNLTIPELLAVISKDSYVQLFNQNVICSKEHLLWAYLNAQTLFKNHENRAKTKSMELLLCASLTTQIGDAIKKMGATSNKLFILFSDNETEFKKLTRYLINTSEFKISKKETEARIKRLGIVSGRSDDLAQEIAFHATER